MKYINDLQWRFIFLLVREMHVEWGGLSFYPSLFRVSHYLMNMTDNAVLSGSEPMFGYVSVRYNNILHQTWAEFIFLKHVLQNKLIVGDTNVDFINYNRNKLHYLSPRANYADRLTAVCRRS
jgi:hypothetical protein